MTLNIEHMAHPSADFDIIVVVCEHFQQIKNSSVTTSNCRVFTLYRQRPLWRYCVMGEATIMFTRPGELAASVDVLPSQPRHAGRQMHRNNVEADSPFHCCQFALYNVFVDNIVDELGDQFIVLKPTFTAQLLIPTNLRKMAADDQLII